LTIIPLIVLGAVIAIQQFDTLQAPVIALQEQAARRASLGMEAFFNERQNELSVLTDVFGLTSLEPDNQRDVLSALIVAQPAYYQLALLDADGQETIRVTRGEIIPTTDLPSRADDTLFQTVMETQNIGFRPVYFNEDARDRMITIALPIEDLFTGETSDVLFAEIRFQNISETVLRELSTATTSASGTQDASVVDDVYIVDSEGIVIAHRNPNLVLNQTVFDPPDTNGRVIGLNGDDVLLATNTLQIENLELTAVAETSYAKAAAVAFDSARLAGIVTVVTLVVAGVIVIWSVSLVVNPITKLSRIAKAIQGGDFSQRSNLKRQDEIGQFATTFNAMTDAIQKREKDLQEQASALRVATAKAQEAARVKGEFLANVSHELRTPLNAIIGFSDMLLAGMSGPLTDKQTHKMERLKENGLRLLALINDLLDLTRIESGRLEMMEGEFSPRKLADRMTAQMESLAVESKLKFETIISPDIPETLMGDEKRVEQVVVNLLSNAFKFTKEGSVTLNMSANKAEKTWTVEVTDTGIGIPPHAVNVIFEEFRQLDGGYSRAYTGSGLGLAITRNLVRMMGGKIAVKSTLGSGSVFTVVLPMNQEKASESLPLASAVS
jgi:signal transduction histidine kinase